MKYLSLIGIFLLSGCIASIPTFPEPPNTAMEKCPILKTVESDVAFSELMKTATANYNTYYQCSAEVDSWIEWYTTQKKNYEIKQ